MKKFLALKNNIERISINMKLQRFYLQNDNMATTNLSNIIDSAFTRIIIFAVSYLWFVQRTKYPIISLLLALIMTLMLSLAIKLWKRRLITSKRVEKRKQVAREFVSEKLSQLNRDEYKWQLMKLLLKMPGIGAIKNRDNYLVSTLNGKEIAIGYHHNPHDNEVSPKKLMSFIHECRMEGFKEAIFVTSGSYKDANHILIQSKAAPLLHLLDGSDLIVMMERSGMIPDDETIDKIIYNKILSQKHNHIGLKKDILTPKRFKTYLAYALFFLVISSIIKAYSFYYAVLSAIFIGMAALTYLWNLKTPIPDNNNATIINKLVRKESNQKP